MFAVTTGVWSPDAKCATMNPDQFDTDTLQAGTFRRADARALCAGCPVVDTCLREALMEDTIGVVRGGVPFPNNRPKAYRTRRTIGEQLGILAEVEEAIRSEKGAMCRKGLHEMVGDNIEPGRDGTKRCRACNWVAIQAYRERRKVAA